MIIECQTCHARFRLDESRIKGRGARVKCRKCGDSIVVLKDSTSSSAPPPSPPAPGGGGFFDLGSAVRDSAGERPGSPPPVGNLIPFPAPTRPEEPGAKESTSPSPGAEAPEKDEVELAFDRLLSAGPAATLPILGEPAAEIPVSPEASAPVEREAPAGPEVSLGPLTLDLGPEEKLDLPPVAEPEIPFGEPSAAEREAPFGEPSAAEREAPFGEPSAAEPEPAFGEPPAAGPEPTFGEPPAAEPEPTFGEPPATEAAAEFRGEGGLLISDADTLNFLQENHREAEPEPPSRVGDISLEISTTPVESTDSFLREPDRSPHPFEDLSSPAPEGTFLEGNVTPPPVPSIEVPPHREAEPAPAPHGEPSSQRVAQAPESPRTRSSSVPAVAAVLVVLLAAGGYLGLTTSGRKTLEGAVPGIAALWRGKPEAPAGPKYDLRNVIGYYESGADSPRILVIKGQVANLSPAEKSGIRVHAALLDNTDSVLVQQVVYAGNVLSGEAIRKGKRDTLTKALGNRFGEGLANMQVTPGKAIPFMVLFFDAPTNIDSYKLEAKEGE
ncbi:MAG: DUF3426 domain-containing protein [bacterium]|jgi:predicted Zn finger-like uncharacterized protein